MTFQQFLDTSFDQEFFVQNPVISLSGAHYPVLFFSLLYTKFQQSGLPVARLSLIGKSVDEMIAPLTMSFLGTTSIFVVADLGQVEQKKRNKLREILMCYQGPNAVIFFDEVDKKSRALTSSRNSIDIPQIDQRNFEQLKTCFFPQAHSKKDFTYGLFARYPSLHLEKACLVLQYSLVVGQQSKLFLNEWSDYLFAPEQSLFNLSSYFFAKQEKEFYITWASLQDMYPTAFWTAYWSDQLFRAYFLVKLCHSRQFAQAKKIAFRLPFSLIQRDWKKLRSEELQQAHEYINDIEFGSKNGHATFGFDLLYAQFFTNSWT